MTFGTPSANRATVPPCRETGLPVSPGAEKTGFFFDGGDACAEAVKQPATRLDETTSPPPFNDCGGVDSDTHAWAKSEIPDSLSARSPQCAPHEWLGSRSPSLSGSRCNSGPQSPLFVLFLMVAPLMVVVTVFLFLSL